VVDPYREVVPVGAGDGEIVDLPDLRAVRSTEPSGESDPGRLGRHLGHRREVRFFDGFQQWGDLAVEFALPGHETFTGGVVKKSRAGG
jgi:hypothetical protein